MQFPSTSSSSSSSSSNNNSNININSRDMIITLAWLVVAICSCLLAQTAPAQAAALSSPESADQLELSMPTDNRQLPVASLQQMVRRRRSSDLWPQAASAQRRASLRQQKLAGDAAFGQQLSELIAQAHADKTLERALLKMLINATLRPSAAAAASSESTVAGEPAPASAASIDQFLASAEQAQREERAQAVDGSSSYYNNGLPAVRLIANLEKILSSSPGFVDQSSSVNSNDLSQLAADAQGVDKREFKPCSFNAVSCARNPFRTS